MKLHTLLAICDAYCRLGTAVQEQVKAVCEGDAVEDQNPEAMRLARRKFIDVARHHGVDVSEWDDAIDAVERP